GAARSASASALAGCTTRRNSDHSGTDQHMADTSISPDAPVPAKKKHRLLKVVVVLVLLVALLVLMAPTLAGFFAPGIVESQASKQIAGHVKVGKASFSWTGPQVIGPLTLSDSSGAQIAQVSVKCSVGLIGLARGKLDLGVVEITGQA